MTFKVTPPFAPYVKHNLEGTPLEIACEVKARMEAQDYKQATDGSGCRMRVKTGTRVLECALGSILPDSCFTGEVDSYGVCELVGGLHHSGRPETFFNLTPIQAATLRLLQSVHDKCATPEAMRDRMSQAVATIEAFTPFFK